MMDEATDMVMYVIDTDLKRFLEDVSNLKALVATQNLSPEESVKVNKLLEIEQLVTQVLAL